MIMLTSFDFELDLDFKNTALYYKSFKQINIKFLFVGSIIVSQLAYIKGAAKKSYCFSGQCIKVFSPPPPGLS